MKVYELPPLLRKLAKSRIKKHSFPWDKEDLVFAFGWIDTPEGCQFWRDVANKRFDQLEKKYLKNL